MDETNKKKCTKCGDVKPTTEFSKDKNKKDGLYPWCKLCKKLYDKTQYANNFEKILEQQKTDRTNNPEKRRATQCKWYFKNWGKNRNKNADYRCKVFVAKFKANNPGTKPSIPNFTPFK